MEYGNTTTLPARPWFSNMFSTYSGMHDVVGAAVVTTHDPSMCTPQTGVKAVNVSLKVECKVM